MSFTAIRPYLRERLKAVDSALSEWKGPKWDDVPAPRLHKSFHIEMGPASQISQNQTVLQSNHSATVRVLFKGHRDAQNAIDEAIVKGEAIIKECLKASNRSTQPGIKNVTLSGMRPEFLSASDQSDVVLTIDFNFLVLIDIS